MKIQKLLLFALAVTIFTACNKDNETAPLAESSISGKFLVPNNTDPIVNGFITASKNDNIVAATRSATDGSFTHTNLMVGEYEISLKKGLFSSAKTIEVAKGNDIQTPNIPIDFLDTEKSGQSLSTEATIFDQDLIDWLQINFGITLSNDDTILLDEFLPRWQVVDISNDATVISWFNEPVEFRDNDNNSVQQNKDLAFTVQIGEGGVFYSSFHTENYDDEFSTVDRLLEYLVF
ncbi:hypothetical protein [Kordia sp.]|uniref:hypothetical protein n=1 Tax=Kordia sp. TaxID=1965332 RepID=UPI003D273629